MPSGNQTSTGVYQQVDTNNEIDLSLCNASDGASNTHNNYNTVKYLHVQYHPLIDHVHNTQTVLRIISYLLYMPDYECGLNSVIVK